MFVSLVASVVFAQALDLEEEPVLLEVAPSAPADPALVARDAWFDGSLWVSPITVERVRVQAPLLDRMTDGTDAPRTVTGRVSCWSSACRREEKGRFDPVGGSENAVKVRTLATEWGLHDARWRPVGADALGGACAPGGAKKSFAGGLQEVCTRESVEALVAAHNAALAAKLAIPADDLPDLEAAVQRRRPSAVVWAGRPFRGTPRGSSDPLTETLLAR